MAWITGTEKGLKDSAPSVMFENTQLSPSEWVHEPPTMPLPPIPSSISILVVEDEEQMLAMIKANLEREGYAVTTATDGKPVVELHRNTPFNLILLDLMLPHVDGFQVLRQIRSAELEVPVLLLTARGEEETKIKGFDLGADDYLTKPFSVLELLSRIKAILRRTHHDAISSDQVILASGPFTLDREKMTFRKGQKKLDIGLHGLRILELLMLRPGHVHSREELINLTWTAEFRPSSDRVVDVHVYSIRKALGFRKDMLATVEGIGYRWAHPVQLCSRS